MLDRTVVFSLTANKGLAEEIVEKLGLDLGKCEVHHFADGEILVNSLHSVRGKNVYIVQSTCAPVTERLMEILVFADSLRRASANEINVVIPYFGYARQDRKAKAREPITARLVADLLLTAGVHRVITCDLHASQIQGFFSCPVDDLSCMPLLGMYFRKKFPNAEDIVVVSPDHGGAVRARKFATAIHAPNIAIIDKRRPRPNVAEVMNIIGDVKGKIAIMIDDMIDTGGTIIAGAKALKANGAKEVYAACTHGVFSKDAINRINNESPFEEVVVTNTIERDYDSYENNKIHSITVANLLAKVIEHIEKGLAVSTVYDVYNC